MVSCSFVDLITINIREISSFTDFIVFLAPLANKIAKLITICILIPYFNTKLYAVNPITIREVILKNIIDMISLAGIIYSSNNETIKFKRIDLGFVKGLAYIVFAYILPSLFMGKILDLMTDNNLIKLGLGFLLIYFIELTIYLTVCIYKKLNGISDLPPVNVDITKLTKLFSRHQPTTSKDS